MTIEEIFAEWETDSKIDVSELGTASIDIPRIHSRWMRRLVAERMELKRLESEHKALRHRKQVFYTQGPDEETQRLGWRLPPRGRILKTEANGYVDSDPDVMALGQRVALAGEKVSAIEDIMKMIHNRSFHVKNSIDWLRFTNGQ